MAVSVALACVPAPKTNLYYNDFNTELVNPKSDAAWALALAKAFHEERTVRLDGVDFQAYLDLKVCNSPELLDKIEELKATMARLHAAGMEALQLDDWEKVTRTCMEALT